MTSMKRILLLGDSITQFGYAADGWTALLSHHYIRRADVINRGLSGYNTRWFKERLIEKPNKLVPPFGEGSYDLVTLFLGANDAATGFQHVGLAEYRSNLIDIVTRLVEHHGITRLILITPGPIDELSWLEFMINRAKESGEEHLPTESNRTNVRAGEYAEAVKEVGRELSAIHKGKCEVVVCDLFVAMMKKGAKECLSDGLHFSPLGNQVLFETLKGVIEMNFTSLVAEAMPFDLPDYKYYERKSSSS